MKRQKQRDDKVKEIEHRPTNTNFPSNPRPPDKTTQLKEARIVDGGSTMEEDNRSVYEHVILNRYIIFHIIFFDNFV